MDNRITIILELLSAGVIASLVAGIFSLVIAFKNNKRLVELEKSKQKFTVNQERYKGLREAYAELLNVLPEEKLLRHIKAYYYKFTFSKKFSRKWTFRNL